MSSRRVKRSLSDDDDGERRKRRKGENGVLGGWLISITSYVKEKVPKKVESFLFGEDLSDDDEDRRVIEKKRVVVFEESSTKRAETNVFKYPKIAKLSSRNYSKPTVTHPPVAPVLVTTTKKKRKGTRSRETKS